MHKQAAFNVAKQVVIAFTIVAAMNLFINLTSFLTFVFTLLTVGFGFIVYSAYQIEKSKLETLEELNKRNDV